MKWLGDRVKKSLAVVLIIAGLVLAVVAIAVGISVVRGHEDRVTSEMVEIADKLEIPSEWELLEDIIRAEQIVCLSTNPCPSMGRRWQTDTELTSRDTNQDSPARRPKGFSNTSR